MHNKNKQPQNIQAEKSLLGRLLKYPDSFTKVEDDLASEMFYDKRHQYIFKACMTISLAKRTIDIVTVEEELKKNDDDIGGQLYLQALMDESSLEQTLVEYAAIIKKKFFFRTAIDGASELIENAYKEDEAELDKSIDELEKKIKVIAPQSILTQLHISSYVAQAFKTLTSTEDLWGVTSGIQSLDDILYGFGKKNLVILAARPSMGKTGLALNMALSAAKLGKRVGFISLEMSGEELAFRLLSIESEVDTSKFKSKTLDRSDWDKVMNGAGRLETCSIHIEEKSGLSSFEIRSLARQMHRQNGLDILYVDYIQIIREKGKRENRNLEVADISGALKCLAQELNIPVVVLSQLSRSLENRENKEPILSDLRDSGAIEQDADIILFLHREYVYNREADPSEAKLIIGKNRNGPTGHVMLDFIRPLITFIDAKQRYS